MMLARAGRLLASLPPPLLHRPVSSLGPLAAAFNAKPSQGAATFKLQWGQEKTGLFGLEELADSRGFHQLKVRWRSISSCSSCSSSCSSCSSCS